MALGMGVSWRKVCLFIAAYGRACGGGGAGVMRDFLAPLTGGRIAVVPSRSAAFSTSRACNAENVTVACHALTVHVGSCICEV